MPPLMSEAVFRLSLRLVAPALFAVSVFTIFGRGAAPFVAFCVFPRVGTVGAQLLSIWIEKQS